VDALTQVLVLDCRALDVSSVSVRPGEINLETMLLPRGVSRITAAQISEEQACEVVHPSPIAKPASKAPENDGSGGAAAGETVGFDIEFLL
jgi:hypothetical protein